MRFGQGRLIRTAQIPQSDCFQSHSVEQVFRSMIQLRLQTQNDELKSTLPLLFCKYQTLGVTIWSSED